MDVRAASGHIPWLDDPRAVASTVTRWLGGGPTLPFSYGFDALEGSDPHENGSRLEHA